MGSKNRIRLRSLMASVLCAGLLFGNTGVVHAAGLDMRQLQQKFPNGAYWNHVVQEGHSSFSWKYDLGDCNNPDGYTWHPCTSHFFFEFTEQEIGWTDCNRYGSSIQCYGFACKLAQDAYGQNFYIWPKEEGKREGIKPGDIIWYYTMPESVYGHQAMVIDVDGDRLCLGECNWCDDCYISWGRWMNVNLVHKWTIYSAPYELPKGGVENLLKEKKGDINQDDARTMEDVRSVLRCTLHMESFDETQQWCADMDGDGRVTLEDALFILKAALGVESIWDTAAREENRFLAFQEWETEFREKFWADIPDDERDEHEDEYWGKWNEAYDKIVVEGDMDFAAGL